VYPLKQLLLERSAKKVPRKSHIKVSVVSQPDLDDPPR
jgi:hypothetical protein